MRVLLALALGYIGSHACVTLRTIFDLGIQEEITMYSQDRIDFTDMCNENWHWYSMSPNEYRS